MKAILFDFGGTLDSNGISCKDVFYCVYKDCGVRVEQDKFDRAFYDADDNLAIKHDLMGLNFEDTFKLHITDVLSNLKAHNERMVNKILNAYLTKTRYYFRQNIPVLAELKKGYKLAIISNFFGNLASVLKSEKLLEYFDATIDSQIIKAIKPDPKIFFAALKELKTPAEDTLMVGDSIERDIEGARSLNMQAALLWGDRFKAFAPPEDLNGTIVLKNLTELPQKLKEINF